MYSTRLASLLKVYIHVIILIFCIFRKAMKRSKRNSKYASYHREANGIYWLRWLGHLQEADDDTTSYPDDDTPSKNCHDESGNVRGESSNH